MLHSLVRMEIGSLVNRGSSLEEDNGHRESRVLRHRFYGLVNIRSMRWIIGVEKNRYVSSRCHGH